MKECVTKIVVEGGNEALGNNKKQNETTATTKQGL